jgi:glyoxylase I family protein
MKIEHLALNVADPVAMAEWYVANLGMRIVRQEGPPGNARFLADSAGAVMLELYHNAAEPIPDYFAIRPATLHLAFCADDVLAETNRLIRAGASVFTEPGQLPSGDTSAMLRDPWGLPLQLIRRVKPMLG